MSTARNVALGAAVVVAGAVAWNALKPKPKPKKKLKDDYVGSGWTWPRPDRFPTTESFGDALNELGYGAAVGLPEWEVLSKETMDLVMVFQSDYDDVREALLKESGVEIGPYIVIDGLIGDSTIRALIFAVDWQRNNPDDSWIALVTDARKQLALA